jgi:hypothetical protein
VVCALHNGGHHFSQESLLCGVQAVDLMLDE